MSISVNGIPTSNISDLFVRDQLMSQLNSAQSNLYQLQEEISSGYQFQTPSQDPTAAIQVEAIQSLLQRYTQELADQETRLDALKRESDDLAKQKDQAQAELDKMIEDLALDTAI